ncbi:MAG TPA: TonB-dependent receptor, partial [Burkholderiales bacterium]|nr:TonB-dependent receptor [Burkholderiales bacterium]
SAAKTVPDLLSQQAGINVRDLFGNNASSSVVDMRGFGSTGAQNTLILVDGRRVSDVDLSGVQWSTVPLASIDRIEVLRGGGAVLYGDGATAGVINIITRTASARRSGAALDARYGSYDTHEVQLSGNYAGANAGFSVQAGNLVSGGYRDNNLNRQSNLLADMYWSPGVGELTLKIASDRQGIRLPGARQVQPSAGVNQFITDPRGTSTPLDYATRDGDRAMLDWRVTTGFGEFNLSGGWRSKAQTSYFDFGGFPSYRTADLDVWSFTPRVKVSLPLAGHANTLITGVDWYRWNYQLLQSNAPGNISRPVNTVTADQQNAAVYVQDTFQISERLTLSGGARHERLNIDAQDRFDSTAPGGAFGSGAPAGSQKERGKAYELSVRYQLAAQTSINAKTGSSFRFANVDEIYETSSAFTNQFQFLRPQKAHTHEVGFETRGTPGRIRASLFTMEVRDEIHLDAFSTGIGNTNLPPSRRRGLELDGQWTVSKSVTLGAAYTFLDARFREGVLPGSAFTQLNVSIAGKAVPLVPRHKLTVNAAWVINAQTRISAVANYVGAQFMDNDEGNTLGVKIPAYTVVDLKLLYRNGPWTLGAAINNLFGEKYFNYAVRSQFVADRYNVYPLPGRNATLNLMYAFR